MKGKNARGTRPALADELYPLNVAIAAAGNITIVQESDVRSGAEVVIHRARQADTSLTFGWGITGPGDIALEAAA